VVNTIVLLADPLITQYDGCASDGQFARIAAMGIVKNPEIFVKTPGAHLNVLSCKNLSIQPVSSPEQDQAKKLLM
jgi:hypothetical protein